MVNFRGVLHLMLVIHISAGGFRTLLVGHYHPAKGWGASFQYDSNEMDFSWVNTISQRFSFDWDELKLPEKNESTWKYLNVPESTWKYFYIATTSFQGGGRKKKFAEDEDFDDSEEGSEMSDSEFEDPDEMEVGLNVSNPKLCVPCVLLNMFM